MATSERVESWIIRACVVTGQESSVHVRVALIVAPAVVSTLLTLTRSLAEAHVVLKLASDGGAAAESSHRLLRWTVAYRPTPWQKQRVEETWVRVPSRQHHQRRRVHGIELAGIHAEQIDYGAALDWQEGRGTYSRLPKGCGSGIGVEAKWATRA